MGQDGWMGCEWLGQDRKIERVGERDGAERMQETIDDGQQSSHK